MHTGFLELPFTPLITGGVEVPVSVRLCLVPFGVVKFVGEKKNIYKARELEKAG